MLGVVPRYAICELYAAAAKDVKGAADSQIDLPAAQLFDRVQIFQASPTAGVCYRDGAPLGQFPYELMINALLKAFVVGGVDQKLGAVRLKEGDGLYVNY